MHITLCLSFVASSKLKPEMVLEDVESDNEFQQKGEDQSKAAAVSKSPSRTPQQCSHTNAEPEPCETVPQEDAETQTGRWTPFIESIKREAEGVALATMEER